MFTTLLEARAGRSRSRGGAVVSFVAHAAVVTLAVVATQNDVGATQDPPRTETVTPVYRPDPPPPPPAAAAAPAVPTVALPKAPRIRLLVIAPVKISNALPTINVANPVTPDIDRTAWRVTGTGTPTSTARSGVGTSSDVLTRTQVEKPALQIAGVGVPVYPELLKEAGIGGEVLATFVVDTTGRAELGTMRVLRSTRSEFGKAVIEALPRMRFLPAQAGGRKVRQLVELPFHFAVR